MFNRTNADERADGAGARARGNGLGVVVPPPPQRNTAPLAVPPPFRAHNTNGATGSRLEAGAPAAVQMQAVTTAGDVQVRPTAELASGPPRDTAPAPCEPVQAPHYVVQLRPQLPVDEPCVVAGFQPTTGHTAAQPLDVPVPPAAPLGRRRSRAVLATPGHVGWTDDVLASQEEGDTRVGWARDTPKAKRPPPVSPAAELDGSHAGRPSALTTLLGMVQEQHGMMPLRATATAPAWEQWLASAPGPGPVAESNAAVAPGSVPWHRHRGLSGAPESAMTPSIHLAVGADRRVSAPTPGSLAAAIAAGAVAPPSAGIQALGNVGMTHGLSTVAPGFRGHSSIAPHRCASSRRRQRRAVLLSLLERIDNAASMDDGDEDEGGSRESEQDDDLGFHIGGEAPGDFEVDPRDLAAMMEVAAVPAQQQEAPQSVPGPDGNPCGSQRVPLQQLSQPPLTLAQNPPCVLPPLEIADDGGIDLCMPPPPAGAPLQVLSVTDEQLDDGPARLVRLRLDDGAYAGAEYLLWLRDNWADMPVQQGDLVATMCEWSPWGDATLGARTGGYAVLHPHMMLTATAVGASLSCVRKAVLMELLGGGAPTAASAFGTATHSVFQAALTTPAGDATHAVAAAGPLVADAMAQQLAAAGESRASFMNHLGKVSGGISGWIEAARGAAGVDAVDVRSQEHKTLQLDGVQDIEHMLWSPRLGLKGQLDATVRTRLDGTPAADVVPFELKTGHFRATREHGAQVVLYTTLLCDIMGASVEEVPYGVLHYSAPNKHGHGAGETHIVVPSASDRTALMQARNTLAASIVNAQRPGGSLPPVVAPIRDCELCFKQRECAVADAVLQQRAAALASPALEPLFGAHTAHLSPGSCDFMRHWDAILGLEVSVLQARAASPWLSPQAVRAKGGACLVDLTLVGGLQALAQPERVAQPGDVADEMVDDGSPSDALFEYALALPERLEVSEEIQLSSGGGVVDTQMEAPLSCFNPGDRVLLSVMPSQPDAPASDVLVVARVICGGLAQRNGQRVVIVHTMRPVQLPQRGAAAALPTQPRWRIDRDDGAGLVTRMRGVLWDCMSGANGARRLRTLVADLAPPQTRSRLGPVPREAPGAAAAAVLSSALNAEQRSALDAALSSDDYLLLRGLPGTGKTATLCAMAAAFVALGHRVLLCAHTHAAVDAACVRLLTAGVPGIWRAGDPARVHPSVRSACVMPGPDEPLPRVVALTASACASPACPLLQLPPSGRSFDVCLLDEAAQTPLPLALAPLRYSTMFVLAGDTAQLAPLWASPEARASGGEESLFARLAGAHPSSVVTLAYQYRMNEHIMALANGLVYAGDLKSGSTSTATRHVAPARPLPDDMPVWMAQYALHPEAGVLFFDTDALGTACAASSRPLRNAGEAHLCARLAALLLSWTQLKHGDVLLLTPYNAQVDLLRECCAAEGLPPGAAEPTTVDRSQGRDVPVVILSCVTTLPLSRVNLLDDARRVCVALTRAQAKLCVVGSRGALCASQLTARMVALCDSHGWTVTLPPDALAHRHPWMGARISP